MKEKIKNTWNRFKSFYKEKYEKNKILTIILTIVSIPILFILLYISGFILLGLAVLLLTFWVVKIAIFGFGKKTTYSSEKNKEISGKTHYGYSEEEVIAIMEASPKLNMGIYDWQILAEALDVSRYTKELKIMYAGTLPIYIFPHDKKPKMNIHFLKENTIESGGDLFEKAKEHFTTNELNNGDICVIYDEKRLTSKDM